MSKLSIIQITFVVASVKFISVGLWTITLRIGDELSMWTGLETTLKTIRHYLSVDA